MGVINTGLNVTAIRGEFFNAFEAVQTFWARLALRIPSTGPSEKYRWLGTVPNVREWGQGRLAKGLRSESYDVDNLKYEATLEVDRDEVADDQLGQINIRIRELAQRAATHKDYLISALLVAGATAGYNSYDGVTFWNGAHVSGASGSQDNDLSSRIVNKDAPTAAEFAAAFASAKATMLAFKDDQGEPMVADGGGLVVMVPPSMEYAARTALNAAILATTSNVLVGMAEVIVNPWLTGTDTWYLLKTNGVVKPFIFQDREPLEFSALEGETDTGFTREKYLYGVRARYRITYGYWQYAVRYVFTTAG